MTKKDNQFQFVCKTEAEIRAWLDKMYFNKIKSFNIHPDLSVTINGNFLVYEFNLNELPFQLKKVSGNVNVSNNRLMSLKGMPKEVQGYLHIHNNCLQTLDYLPQKVKDYIHMDMCSEKEFLKLGNIESFTFLRIEIPKNQALPDYMIQCGKIQTVEYFTQDSFDTPRVRQSVVIEFDEYKAYFEKKLLNKNLKTTLLVNPNKNKL